MIDEGNFNMVITPLTSPIKAIAADMLGVNPVWADDKTAREILGASGHTHTSDLEATWTLTTMVASGVNIYETGTIR